MAEISCEAFNIFLKVHLPELEVVFPMAVSAPSDPMSTVGIRRSCHSRACRSMVRILVDVLFWFLNFGGKVGRCRMGFDFL